MKDRSTMLQDTKKYETNYWHQLRLQRGRKTTSFFYQQDYSEAVIAAGGIPFLLPIIKNKNDVKPFTEKNRRLALTGGNDVPPQHYGEERHEKTVCVHPDKDISDITLVGTAIRMKKSHFGYMLWRSACKRRIGWFFNTGHYV